MTFQNPAGLWLLLGVPVLIVIFLIRSQHEDQKVSSTYVWKLSEKFMKKRLPLQSLRRLLLLALQILAVVLAAFLAARPMIAHRPNTDYILVIDSSASMMTVDKNGVSRFENAKKQVRDLAKKTASGHRVSVISASDDPNCPVRLTTSQNEVQTALSGMSCTFGNCDLDKTFELVNEITADCQNPQVIFYTDRTCGGIVSDRVKVVDLSGNEANLSVVSVTAVKNDDAFLFTGEILSNGYNGTTLAALKIDGETVDAVEVDCADGQTAQVTFSSGITTYDRAEIFVTAKDALEADNRFVLCRRQTRHRSVLVVGTSPLYIENALRSIENCRVDVVRSVEDMPLEGGYDLYVFDGIAPADLPTDGSMIFFNCENMPVGLSYGEAYDKQAVIVRHKDVGDKIAVGWDREEETYVAQYKKLFYNAAYTPLFACGEIPVAAYRVLPSGKAIVAASFDLHDTNLPLQRKYLDLTVDLIELSAPSMIEKSSYSFGEQVIIRVMPYTKELYVKDQDAQIRALPIVSGASEYMPLAPGLFTAVQMYGAETGEYADFFVHIPESEYGRDDVEQFPPFIFEGGSEQKKDASLEITLWIAVAMLVLLLVEWGLYYYEQI